MADQENPQGAASEPKSYVAVAPCGCLQGAAVDDPKYRGETSRYVARWIRAGLEIQLLESEAVREMPWMCPTHQAEIDAKRAASGKQERVI